MFNAVEPFIVAGLTSASSLTDGYIVNAANQLGDKINDAIESTETQLDDLAKDKAVLFLETVLGQLKVDGVDEGV